MPHIQHEGASLFYQVSGRGEALVFAHGMGGNTLSWWQQVPHFAERYRVLCFDHRCFGRSRCAPEDFHPRHFAGDLRAILDAEGIERAALVCQSMGGWSGLALALAEPQRVTALLLADTPAGLFPPAIARAGERIREGVAREGVRGNLALAPDFPARHPELAYLYEQISSLNQGFDVATAGRLGEARIDPEALAGWRIPTLVLAGEQDQLFPPDALAEVAALIPGAEFARVPESGHSVYFESPARFNEILADFLEGRLSPAS